MISFKQYLAEARGGSLYHGTPYGNAIKILEDNVLLGNPSHGGETPEGFGIRVVSLTRSLRTALNWRYYGIALELDYRKLSYNHKIRPIEIENIWAGYMKNLKVKGSELFEEYVVGDINNLSRYLIAIHVKESIAGIYGLQIVNYCKKNNIKYKVH